MSLRRVPPPSIDPRNEIEREMDLAVRAVHRTFGNDLRGYVLVAYDHEEEPIIDIAGEIPGDILTRLHSAMLSAIRANDKPA